MSERADVLVTRPIMDEPLARLRERCDVTVHENEFGIPRPELLDVVRGRDALITMLTEQVDAELLAAAGPQLKIVANHAVGFDNVNVADCTAAGVLATNTPDVLTETTADTAFALLLAGARRVGEG
jgi:glyoxylate reductase